MADEADLFGAGEAGGSSEASGWSPPVASETAQASAPQAPAAAAPTSSAPLPTAPGGGQAAAAPGGEQWQGVRDALAAYGIDLRPQFKDDHSALQHMALAYRQAQEQNQLAQYGQEYLRHAQEFQAWQRQQQQARQPQSAEPWWKAPAYDPSWEGRIYRDQQTGEWRAMPGAPADTVSKFLQWQDHQRGFLNRFSQDPLKAIQPGVEDVARRIASEMIQEHLGTYRQEQQATGFVAENSSWLHARDAQGGLQYGPNGQPKLSPLGESFARYVDQAARLGIQGVEQQRDFALTGVQRDYLLALSRGVAPAHSAVATAPGAPPAQPTALASPGDAARAQREANQRFLSQAAAGHRANTSGSVNAPAPNGNQPSQNSALSLYERLSNAMQQSGYQLSTTIPVGPGGR